MSKMVTARVPDAIYESACNTLHEIGSSPSELINAAFEFVLKEGALPSRQAAPKRPRRLNKKQKAKLRQLFATCTLGVDSVDDVEDDKRIAREARAGKYEALA